jgi:hypothetical protein
LLNERLGLWILFEAGIDRGERLLQRCQVRLRGVCEAGTCLAGLLEVSGVVVGEADGAFRGALGRLREPAALLLGQTR